MSKKIHVSVGKRTVQLSNLDKILYPKAGILKAEIIQYYLKIAPLMLTHMKGRPLSLVRFPDGISGEQFFQKNKPEWAPEWVDYIRLGRERKKEYIVVQEEAALIWLANLACLEIHQMHGTHLKPEYPDYIVYDLDPPEGFSFSVLKEIAFRLREHLEGYGYHPFVKTTGGKGLHIVTPIVQNYSFDEAFAAAKKVAESFIQKEKETTLHIQKEARKGRVLVDIYRNRPQQTIISAYSVRGKEEAPVACPVTWEELSEVGSSQYFKIEDVLVRNSDPWETIRAWAVNLHTDRKSPMQVDLPANTKRKTPEQLKEYESKRDFTKTPEPDLDFEDATGNRFVIQRHHASRLHYDLRLEKDGVLLSWAIPRGMPPYPGVKRLAVQTEDHPLKYLTFEGEIPREEYGGGTMWIYAQGRYEITKEKKEGFYFRLTTKSMSMEYRMHRMKEREWLLERVDSPRINFLGGFTKPMLAESKKKVPIGNYVYEIKWDGIRAVFVLINEEVKIYSRNGNDITDKFPELSDPKKFIAYNGVFDAEIVCLDTEGKADFKKVLRRLMSKNPGIKTSPAVAYFFDCMYLDGKPLTNDSLIRRKAWLEDLILKNYNYRISKIEEDGASLFEAVKSYGMEGVMAKEKEGKYFPGSRSETWIKVKSKSTSDCYILGYTSTDSERKKFFAALQVAEKIKDQWVYRGRVGTGFDQAQLADLKSRMVKLHDKRPNGLGEVHEEAKTNWINPVLLCEVEYSMITERGTFRDPVFKKMLN